MNGLEDRLRDAYLAAAELVREDMVPAQAPVRRAGPKRRAAWAKRRAAWAKRRAAPAGGARTRPARRAWGIAPLATAAMVAAIAVTVSVVVPHLLSGQQPRRAAARHTAAARPTGRQTAPARPPADPGLPEFTLVSTSTGLQVVQTATGHVTGQVSAPAGLTFDQVAGDGSDRTFYVSAQQQTPCRAYFYRFRLSAGGQPSGLMPLPGSGQAGLPTALAASADGRKLAFSVVRCASGGATKIPLGQAIGYIAVLDTTSGKTAGHWTYTLSEDYPTDMALTANGGLLAFAQYLPDGSAVAAKTLRTDAPSGTVDQASTVVGLRGVSSLAVGPALYGCVSADRSRGRVASQLGAYDLATGERTAVLHTWTGPGGTCTLAPNPVHGHLLVAIATTQPGPGMTVFNVRVLAVDVRTGRLTGLMTITGSPTFTIIGW